MMMQGMTRQEIESLGVVGVLEVMNDSMEPENKKGDLLLYSTTKEPANGDKVIVNRMDRLTVERYQESLQQDISTRDVFLTGVIFQHCRLYH